MARRRPYDFKVDAWAAGVVAYMLLAGEPPFADWDAIREGRSPQKDGLLRNIRRGKPDTAIDDLHLSPGAKSLLHNLLHLDPQKRMSCKEAAEHYWVREKGVASHADALGEFIFIFGNLLAILFGNFWQWSVWAIRLTACFVDRARRLCWVARRA